MQGFSLILDCLSNYLSIHQFITPLSLCLSVSVSLSLSLSLSLCRLDLSQLFAGFKDKEILIELLCNSTSQCITRQLDINRPAFVRVHLPVCVCVRGGQCEFVYLWLKAFPLIQLEAAVICCRRPARYPPKIIRAHSSCPCEGVCHTCFYRKRHETQHSKNLKPP